MAITTVTSREFNQDVSRIKRVAANGPVFITDRGRPAHVLLTIKEYQKLTKTKKNMVDLIAMANADEHDFKPAKLKKKLYRREDFK